MLVVDRAIDVPALLDLVVEQYGHDGSPLEFVPVGGDSWCFRAGALWVSARRDRQGHVPAAYEGAVELAEAGADWVLAPLRGADGRVVHHAGAHPVIVSPYESGETLHARFTGDFDAIWSVVQRLHAARVSAELPREEYRFPFQEELTGALAIASGRDSSAGPYCERVERLVRTHRDHLDGLAREADRLARHCRADDTPLVVTHLEPNGNVMRTADGRVLLFDWGMLAYGPPERDWWDFDRLPDRVALRPEFARFYELRWILGEVAEYVWRFVHPHTDNDDDKWMWSELQSYFPS